MLAESNTDPGGVLELQYPREAQSIVILVTIRFVSWLVGIRSAILESGLGVERELVVLSLPLLVADEAHCR